MRSRPAFFQANSLRKRLTITLSAVALFCVAMVGFVSYRAIRSIEKNRLQTAIVSDVRRLSDWMDREYLALIHASQQMLPGNSIGNYVEEYLRADGPYNRIIASRNVSENINMTTFSNPQMELVMYFEEREGEIAPYFSNVTPRKDFAIAELPSLRVLPEMIIQGIHPSQSRFSNNQVISILRQADFGDGYEWYVYLEARTNITDNMEQLSQMQDIPYYLLQIDGEGKIHYSELEEFQVGNTLDLPDEGENQEDMGNIGDYIWIRSKPIYGFYNVILLPAAGYNRELTAWKWDITMVAFFSIALIFVVSLVMRNYFYRPIRLLGQEMGRFGQGNLDRQDYKTGLQEFDSLFGEFNRLKEQIGQLMESIYHSEMEKRQLELDKLYYQINPHFIMNALNSVHWMALMHNQQDIAIYLSRLNYLLGYTLGKVSQTATLRTELEVLTAYLEMQKARCDFQVWTDVEEGYYLDERCARLILQPLAENAICHSINDFGNLWVSIKPYKHMIQICIRDDGQGFDSTQFSFEEQPEKGSERQINPGIGLRYVWLTLESFYGGAAAMEIDSAPGEGTTVTLRLPYKKDEWEGGGR